MGNGASVQSCDTSWNYRVNCSGGLNKCSHCSYTFCAYHFPPAGNVAQLVGGHVCTNAKTSGAFIAAPVNAVNATIEATGKWSVDLGDNFLVGLLIRCSQDCYLYDGKKLGNNLKLVKQLTERHINAGVYQITRGKHNGKKILAFRGSAEAMDWVGNLESWIGVGLELRAAVKQGERWATEYGVDFLTGHSRGGCIAQGVCGFTGLRGAAFQSLTVYSSVPQCNVLEAHRYNGVGFEIHSVHGDIVSELPNTIPTSKHIGVAKWHNIPGSGLKAKHSIDTFCDTLCAEYGCD